MSKLNQNARNALLSARAKNRKAAIALGTAGTEGVTVPKHVVAKMTALNEWFDAQLTTSKPKAKADETAETSEAVAEAA